MFLKLNVLILLFFYINEIYDYQYLLPNGLKNLRSQQDLLRAVYYGLNQDSAPCSASNIVSHYHPI